MTDIKLPDKLSELGRLALRDMDEVLKNPKYKLDMGEWHRQIHNTCHVCLAGCIMARTFKIPFSERSNPVKFDEREKLWALHDLQSGYVHMALTTFGVTIKHKDCPPDFNGYADSDPAKWRKQIEIVLTELESKGL